MKTKEICTPTPLDRAKHKGSSEHVLRNEGLSNDAVNRRISEAWDDFFQLTDDDDEYP